MTFLPGLIDAHTHIACLRRYDSNQLRNPMKFFTETTFATQSYLDYGFMTIRDCGVPLRVDAAMQLEQAFLRARACSPAVWSSRRRRHRRMTSSVM